MALGPVGKKKRSEKEPAERSEPDSQVRLQTSRQAYNEMQRQFQIYDGANENLEKKAQNVMIASALLATLFVTVATTQVAQRLWGDSWAYVAIGHLSVVSVAIILCILVNRASSYAVPISGEKLLCHDELDENVYNDLISNEEEYYKLLIKEYARTLVKMADTSMTKARRLNYAYWALAASVFSYIGGLVFAIVL